MDKKIDVIKHFLTNIIESIIKVKSCKDNGLDCE